MAFGSWGWRSVINLKRHIVSNADEPCFPAVCPPNTVRNFVKSNSNLHIHLTIPFSPPASPPPAARPPHSFSSSPLVLILHPSPPAPTLSIPSSTLPYQPLLHQTPPRPLVPPRRLHSSTQPPCPTASISHPEVSARTRSNLYPLVFCSRIVASD